MNKIFTILVLLISSFLVQAPALAQQNRSPVEEVVYALRNNRLQEVTRNFDNFVPISINNNASNYSRNQAEVVFNNFFEKNPIRELSVMDMGAPSASAQSMIATFSTTNGGRYTLYISIKLKDNGYTIKELRISKE